MRSGSRRSRSDCIGRRDYCPDPWMPARSLAARGEPLALPRGGCARRLDRLVSRRGRADLALFHEFEPAPAGGGHQFLRALVRELESRGLVVETNRISGGTPACLFNSFNFDFGRLRRFAREDCRMVHRVDGPIGVVPRLRRRDGRADRRDQRGARRRDRAPVALQPREARGARDRASRSGRRSRTPSIRRSSIRRRRGSRSAGGRSARDRVELVAESAEGRGRPLLARRATSTRRWRR